MTDNEQDNERDLNPSTGLRNVYKASEQAMQPIVKKVVAKYPWSTIAVGEAFCIFKDEMKANSVRPYVSRMGKKYNKNFKVTAFEKVYEVARLPDKIPDQMPAGIINALDWEKKKEEEG